MKTETGSGKKFPGRFLIILFQLFLSQQLFATQLPEKIPGDTDEVAQEQYDINDPRNPDCPCHQWQKQADEEYQQMQHQQTNSAQAGNVDQNNKTNDEQESSADDSENDVESDSQSQNSDDDTKVKKRSLPHIGSGKKAKKMLRRIGRKRNGTKRSRRHGVDCFHF